jgi:hypothetical protein
MDADDTLNRDRSQSVRPAAPYLRGPFVLPCGRESGVIDRPGGTDKMELEIWQWALLVVAILLIVGLVVMKTKKK